MFVPSTYVEKPWGGFRQFTHNEETTVKILEVTQGEALSLQLHHLRREHWFVISGNPTITCGDDVYVAHPGDEVFVDREMKHRIAADEDDVQVLEVAYGNFQEHEDIVRLEDRYART